MTGHTGTRWTGGDSHVRNVALQAWSGFPQSHLSMRNFLYDQGRAINALRLPGWVIEHNKYFLPSAIKLKYKLLYVIFVMGQLYCLWIKSKLSRFSFYL